MALFETWLKSDLKKPMKVEQLKGNLFSADNGGNLIGVEVMDNGTAATLTGNVYGYVIRADGATVTIEGTLSDNKASIVLPASAYAVVGQASIAIKVGTTTVGACTAYVYRTTTDMVVDPGSVVPDISELLAMISDCEAATTAAINAATAAGYVNIAMSKSGKVITVTTTNSSNQTTSATVTEPTLTVSESNGTVTVTATDADGTTTVTFETADEIKNTKADAINCEVTTPAEVMTIPDGADGMPMALQIAINPVQAGSGDPSPTNQRVINGWTKARIGVTKKNLLGGEALRDAIKAHLPGAVIDTTNKTISWSNSATISDDVPAIAGERFGILCNFKFNENTQYTFIITCSVNGNAQKKNLRIVYTDGTSYDIPQETTKQTVVYSSNSTKSVLDLHKRNHGDTTTVYYEESGIFEGELTAADFEAWQGNQYEVTFPDAAGTVYGGTLTINKDGSGSLYVDHVLNTYDGDEGWTSGGGGFYIGSLGISVQNGEIALCDRYYSMPAQNIAPNGLEGDKFIFLRSSYNRLYIRNTDIADTTAFTQSLSTNPIHVYIRIGDPQTYELTASQIKSLLGLNNLYCDTGDVLSVDYSADTKLYIEKLTQPTEDDMTANNNIASGKFFMIGNSLFLSTASIATGETIVPGTNCTRVSLADALNAINE